MASSLFRNSNFFDRNALRLDDSSLPEKHQGDYMRVMQRCPCISCHAGLDCPRVLEPKRRDTACWNVAKGDSSPVVHRSGNLGIQILVGTPLLRHYLQKSSCDSDSVSTQLLPCPLKLSLTLPTSVSVNPTIGTAVVMLVCHTFHKFASRDS